jgi:hypothetical protein
LEKQASSEQLIPCSFLLYSPAIEALSREHKNSGSSTMNLIKKSNKKYNPHSHPGSTQRARHCTTIEIAQADWEVALPARGVWGALGGGRHLINAFHPIPTSCLLYSSLFADTSRQTHTNGSANLVKLFEKYILKYVPFTFTTKLLVFHLQLWCHHLSSGGGTFYLCLICPQMKVH